MKARHVTAFDRATVSLPPINNDKEPPIDRALDTIAVPTSTGRNSRRYFCVYCKKLFAKLTNHLQGVHKNERAVQQYMLLPSGTN